MSRHRHPIRGAASSKDRTWSQLGREGGRNTHTQRERARGRGLRHRGKYHACQQCTAISTTPKVVAASFRTLINCRCGFFGFVVWIFLAKNNRFVDKNCFFIVLPGCAERSKLKTPQPCSIASAVTPDTNTPSLVVTMRSLRSGLQIRSHPTMFD